MLYRVRLVALRLTELYIPAGGLVHNKDNKLIAEIPIGGSVKLVAPRQQLDVTDPNAV